MLGWMRENEPWDETLQRFRVLRNSILRLFLNAEAHDLERYGTHTRAGRADDCRLRGSTWRVTTSITCVRSSGLEALLPPSDIVGL